MITLYCTRADGARIAIEVEPGASLMQTAVNHGVAGILGECGGAQQCATCHVYIDSPWRERLRAVAADEDAMLDSAVAERRTGSRLACQIAVDATLDGFEFALPERQV